MTGVHDLRIRVMRPDEIALAAMRRNQRTREARSVLDRHVRADAPIRCHRMDGVSEEGNATRAPGRMRNRGADRQARDRGRICEPDQLAKSVRPAGHGACGGRRQRSAVRLLDVGEPNFSRVALSAHIR